MKREAPQVKLDWRSVNTENCPVAAAMKVVGDKWTLLIVRDAFMGVKRFDDFCAQTGAPRALVASRLRDLVADGILQQEAYREAGSRPRQQYVLTSKGRDLQHVLTALREWGDAHVNAPGKHPLELVEKETGEAVRLGLLREKDGGVVASRGVRLRPGPGMKRR